MIIQGSTTQMASITSTNVGHLTINTSEAHSQDNTSISSQSDSLTISAKGMALFADTQKLSSSVLNDVKNEIATSTSSDTNTLLTSSTSDDDEETTTTSDLSGYSDAQLKQLVADGTISEAEAAAEIAKRQTNKSNQDNDSAQNTDLMTHIDLLI